MDGNPTHIFTPSSQRFAFGLRLYFVTTPLTMIRYYTLTLLILGLIVGFTATSNGQQHIAWQQSLGTQYSDYALTIFPDEGGNIIVIGKEPHADFAGNVKTYMVTAKFNPEGQELWKTYHDVAFDVFSVPTDYGLGGHFYTEEFGDTLLNLIITINNRVLQYKILDHSGQYYFYEEVLSGVLDVDRENEKVYADVRCSIQPSCYGPDSLIVQRFDPSPDSLIFDPIEWSFELKQNFRTAPIQGHYDFDVQDIRMDGAGNTFLLVQIERWDFQFCTDCADAFIDAWCEVFKFDAEGNLVKNSNLKTAKAVVSAMQFLRLDSNQLIVAVRDINAAGTKVIPSIYRLDADLTLIKKINLNEDFKVLMADQDLNVYAMRNAFDEANPEIHGLSDVLVAKYNADGQLIWDEYYGGSSWDFPVSMSLTKDSGLYFLANSESSDFDVTFNAGGQDIWLVKLGENTTAMHDVSDTRSLMVYPNPTTGETFIGEHSKGMHVTVYDLQGREMMRKRLGPVDTNIDLVTLPAGYYMLRGVNESGAVFTAKLVKE